MIFSEISAPSGRSASIAYKLKAPPPLNDKFMVKSGDTITVEIEAFQCSGSGMPDAIGFRLYPDCDLKKLDLTITLCGALVAQKLVKNKSTQTHEFQGGMASYLEPLRRIGYEDGPIDENGNLKLELADNKSFKFQWSKSGEGKHRLIPGYFHGLCWDRLRMPNSPTDPDLTQD